MKAGREDAQGFMNSGEDLLTLIDRRAHLPPLLVLFARQYS